MDEFSVIELLTSIVGVDYGALEGVGDDASILPVPPGQQLVVSTDTLVEGVHFSVGENSENVGYKALASSISDLAAMGASPAWFFLALTLPSMNSDWVRGFARGIRAVAREAPISLVGGDVTSGPLNITVTVCGLVEAGAALTRKGAMPGDFIGITGPTGLAGKALADQEQGIEPAPACEAALNRPRLRLKFAQGLVGLANSCIDVSDGLLADLTHISEASGVGIRIDLERLPVPPELSELPDAERWDLQLGGGDDYELCFTTAPDRWHEVERLAAREETRVFRIGAVVTGGLCLCIRPDGEIFRPVRSGYVHGVPS